jgi:glucose/arabinose dehydrogenase
MLTNIVGDPSVPNEQWYGYPTCFTVWEPSVFIDTTFKIGEQFVLEPNSTFNDDNCVKDSKPPTLGFQAHSAPLDCKFDADSTTLYVTLHGSWNRDMPTGFKVVTVPFTQDEDGAYTPVAPSDSNEGYDDLLWTEDTSDCSAINCLRPVGLAFGKQGQLYLTSDTGGAGELFVLSQTS